MKKTYLFIGGPKDGERAVMALAPQTLCVRVPKLAPAWEQPDEPGLYLTMPDAMFMADEFIYNLVSLAGNSERFHVYALDGMAGDAIMFRLLMGYRKT